MLEFSRFKIFSIIAVCFLAVYFTIPNFIENPEKYKFLSDKKLNLGLDLRGGSYLLLEVDFNAYFKEKIDNLRNEIRDKFRGKEVNGEKIKYNGGLIIQNDKIKISLINDSISDEVVRILKEVGSNLEIINNKGEIAVGFTPDYIKTMKNELIEQSMRIIRNRVDETGTKEPDIQKQGDSRIIVQVPGLSDPEKLKKLLGKTAKMTFHLLDESSTILNQPRGSFTLGVKNLPSEDGKNTYAIKEQVMLSGDLLTDAKIGTGQYGEQVVNITFDNVGAKKFADITKANIGKPFAIVLDGKVITAPVIRSAIIDGNAQISGNFTVESARDLSVMLRAGALVAPLNIIEERTVGPTLGSDSIEAGKKAMIWSFVMVSVFMILFYGFFGLVAILALLVNILMIFAALSLFGASLTMPGIAGIVLTIGMAVDANVIIFERIKDEINLGKSPFSAIDSGFKHAYSAIFDSNITTLGVSLILYLTGTGPIKGFAVTLGVGILASMFSAILLSRSIIALWLKKTRPKFIPI